MFWAGSACRGVQGRSVLELGGWSSVQPDPGSLSQKRVGRCCEAERLKGQIPNLASPTGASAPQPTPSTTANPPQTRPCQQTPLSTSTTPLACPRSTLPSHTPSMTLCRFYAQGYCRNGSTKVAFFLFFLFLFRGLAAARFARRWRLPLPACPAYPITRRHGMPVSPRFMPNQILGL